MNESPIADAEISRAMALLHTEVGNSSKARVADRLGVSRTAISLIMNGKYPSRLDKIAAKVLNVFGKVECPYLGIEIELIQCHETHSGPAPTWDPSALAHRRACQACPNNQPVQRR